VRVTAHRRGYNAIAATSQPTSAVALGVIDNLRAPELSGRAMVGHRLTASAGAWSITPSKVRYQWRIDGHHVRDATSARYLLAAADGGHKVSVRVVVRAAGYAASSRSSAPVRVLFGRASFAHRPIIRGQAIVGRTLTARVGAHRPRIASATYRWYRDGDAIRHAVDRSYDVRPRDVGQHLTVRVTLHARHWAPATRWSARTAAVQPAV
jgi:hypothetical protein